MAAEPIADVALILEGTYPYVLGGVSAWVDQIIRGLPETRFALFFIGSQKEEQKMLYQLPPNVVSLSEMYLHDHLSRADLAPGRPPAEMRAGIYQALADFYGDDQLDLDYFWTLIDRLREAGDSFTFGNLCHDRESWELVQAVYQRYCPDESFIDFFWTARFLHLPLWSLWRAYDQVPHARVYHSISAGYAGMI